MLRNSYGISEFESAKRISEGGETMDGVQHGLILIGLEPNTGKIMLPRLNVASSNLVTRSKTDLEIGHSVSDIHYSTNRQVL